MKRQSDLIALSRPPHDSVWHIVYGWAAIVVLCACNNVGPTTYTSYPIAVDLGPDGNGPLTAEVELDMAPGSNGGGSVRSLALMDTMSPLSVIDRVAFGESLGQPSRRRADIDIFGYVPPANDGDGDGDSDESVVQARFVGLDTFDLHPCASTTPDTACSVGIDEDTRDIGVIIGANALSRSAVRLDFHRQQMQLFPDITGKNSDRTNFCDAVFETPFYGGGTMVIGNAEVPFNGRRIAIGACLYTRELALSLTCDEDNHPSCPEPGEQIPTETPTDDPIDNPSDGGPADAGVPDATPDSGQIDAGPADGSPNTGDDGERDRGLDALFVLSTGLPISLVTTSFYQRYREYVGPDTAPALDTLTLAEISLISGPVSARLGQLGNMALVAEVSDQRGPCDERYATLYLTRCHGCTLPEEVSQLSCSSGDESTCRSGAVAEVEGGFPVAIVSDQDPNVQALREELRPALPEVDGILAPGALRLLTIDIDYANNRVLARCSAPSSESAGESASDSALSSDSAGGCRIFPARVSAENINRRTCGDCPAPTYRCSLDVPP